MNDCLECFFNAVVSWFEVLFDQILSKRIWDMAQNMKISHLGFYC